MSNDNPRPGRVTLSDEERSLLADAFDHEVEANCWREACEEGVWDVTSRILAAREQALREEIAGEIEACGTVTQGSDSPSASTYRIGYGVAQKRAARIARGGAR